MTRSRTASATPSRQTRNTPTSPTTSRAARRSRAGATTRSSTCASRSSAPRHRARWRRATRTSTRFATTRRSRSWSAPEQRRGREPSRGTRRRSVRRSAQVPVDRPARTRPETVLPVDSTLAALRGHPGRSYLGMGRMATPTDVETVESNIAAAGVEAGSAGVTPTG